jgi:tRNA(Ser,Leu) C12 N-acetylase TAN1
MGYHEIRIVTTGHRKEEVCITYYHELIIVTMRYCKEDVIITYYHEIIIFTTRYHDERILLQDSMVELNISLSTTRNDNEL